MSLLVRALISTLALELLFLLTFVVPGPLLNILLIFMLFIAVSAWVRLIYKRVRNKETAFGRVSEHAWSVLVTFVFITFTRLFFRSGSNLDPAVANETAWSIATRMVKSIGTQWNADILPIISTYHNVFLLFVMGMIIHWLPSRFKFRYRVMFAKLPLPVICLCAIIAVFIVYQFVTAELQPFIYFQF